MGAALVPPVPYVWKEALNVDKKKLPNAIYLILALAMVLIAIPRLELGAGGTLSTVFGLIWIGFALLVIAANLYTLLGVDEETRQQLDRIRLAKRRMWQLKLERGLRRSKAKG